MINDDEVRTRVLKLLQLEGEERQRPRNTNQCNWLRKFLLTPS